MLLALLTVVTLCDLVLHVAHPWFDGLVAGCSVVCGFLPGMETLMRTFRNGYREDR